MSKKKKRKTKTVYIDDGRSLADMSALSGASSTRGRAPTEFGFKAKFRTYFESVKLMILPMIVTLCLIGVAFLLLYLLLSLA